MFFLKYSNVFHLGISSLQIIFGVGPHLSIVLNILQGVSIVYADATDLCEKASALNECTHKKNAEVFLFLYFEKH